ncbi:FAD binding domain containing protein [Amanita muscaria]
MESPSRWLQSLIIIVTLLLFACSAQAASCKCFSFQPCWPSPSDFSKLELASQLSQPLIVPIPAASACYLPFNSYCIDVQSHLHDGPWRSDLPGTMQVINFENYMLENGTTDACYYNVQLGVPCHQGNIPVVGVDARNVGDVQAAVNFTAKHYLRLVIKNTGHDVLGRSMARGAFMLRTHNLKDIAYDEAFILSGAPPNCQTYKALTVGAGVEWHKAYEVAKDHGRAIVGATSLSVGAAGGWIQGGGHSALSPIYGLGVDNALQFTVVLASGQYITANKYQYQDLFGALRGGGGGTYGVVIPVTYRTHDILPTTLIQLLVTFQLITIQPALQDAGWGGFAYLSETGINSFTFVPDDSLAQGDAIWLSFIIRIRAAGVPVTVHKQSFPSFYEAARPYFGGQGLIGTPSEFISRFLSRRMAQEQPGNVAKVSLGLRGSTVALLSVAGGVVSKVNPDSTGLHPSWREALGTIESMTTWEECTPAAEINRLRQIATVDLEALDTTSPDSGTYLNSASLYEKDFRKAFFGTRYPRLKAIKKAYDPDDLFLVAEGVGSDDWDKSLSCRGNRTNAK